MIRPARTNDAEELARIYNHYVMNTTITFEEVAVSPAEMALRMADVVDACDLPWLVLEHEKTLAGYAYASKWKARSAYRFSVESTVYLDPQFVGRGLGTRLYETLLEQLRQRRIHTVLGGIALPNPASIALHERFGFKQVARFQEVGRKFDRWVDVGYWQLSF